MSAAAPPANPSVGDLFNLVKQVADKQAAIDQRIAHRDAARNTGATPAPRGFVPGSPPAVRRGENTMSSRGFSFSRILGVVGHTPGADRLQCQTELDVCDRLMKKMIQGGYRPSTNAVLIPIAPEFFPDDLVDNDFYLEMKGMINGGLEGVGRDELMWAAQRTGLSTKGADGLSTKASPVAGTPAMSWIDQSVGGSFVPPPTFGPPIELLRNVETLLTAGATIVPLGPSGRLIMPRLTAATTGSWAGENTPQNPTTPTTGQLELSAKKVIGVVVIPNELLRFGAPATEALVRADLFKTVALIMDQGLLEGPGSSNVPLGLATAAAAANNPYGFGQVTVTSNQLSPQQAYDFLSAIWANNGTPRGFIMRPEMLAAFYKSRWTPYSGGTSLGGFVFEFQRNFKGEVDFFLAGLPVTISANLTKSYGGNSNQSYVFCGDWPDYYLGMFGAIEFTQTDAGYNLLASDQTAVRAILSCDGGPRHPGVFSFAPGTNFTVAG